MLAVDQRARILPFANEIREQALSVIAALPPETPLYLVVLKNEPEILLGKSTDRPAAVQKIRTLSPGPNGGDTETLLNPLADLTDPSEKSLQRIFLGRLAKGETLPANWQMLPVGRPLENIAILNADLSPVSRTSEQIRVTARIGNFTNADFRGELQLSEGKKLLAIHPLEITAGKEASVSFETSLSRADAHSLSLRTIPDSSNVLSKNSSATLIQDDTFLLDLPARPSRRVLLVGGDKNNLFLEKLLSVTPALVVDKIPVADWTPERSSTYDISIFDQVLPLQIPLKIWRENNLLFLGAHPALPDAPVIPGTISEENSDHPLLQNTSLLETNLVEARDWKALLNNSDWPADILLQSPGGPLLLAGEFASDPPKRWAALAFDISRSDLPLRPAFPLLMDNLISWLSPETVSSLPAKKIMTSRESDLRIPQPKKMSDFPLLGEQRQDRPTSFLKILQLKNILMIAALLLLLFEFGFYYRDSISIRLRYRPN